MRKVTVVSLGGNAYQLEEGAHDAVATYLERAARALQSNPDRTEILADLEQAIADKCDSFLGKHKNVICDGEVSQILREMGPVQAGDAFTEAASPDPTEPADAWAGAQAPAGSAPGHSRRRRLMRVPG